LLAKQLARRLEDASEEEREDLAYLERFSGAQRGLLRVFQDCRDHGIDRDAPEPRSRMGRLTLSLFEDQRRTLDAQGLGGDPVQAALQAWERPSPMDPTSVLVFAPGLRPPGPLLRLARALASRALVEWIQGSQTMGEGIPARAALLFRRQKQLPEPADGVELYSAQGDEEELREALQRARDLIARGAAPHRIAIVCPSMSPYRVHLASLARETGVPIADWSAASLFRENLCSLALDMTELVCRGIPRKLLIRCLADPLLDRSAFGREAGFHETSDFAFFHSGSLALLDRISREEGCLGGAERLSAAVEGWLEEKQSESRLGARLKQVLNMLASVQRGLGDAATAAEQGELLASFLERSLSAGNERQELVRDLVLSAARGLADWTRLGLAPIATGELPGLLRDLCRECRTQPRDYSPEGIRVLPLGRIGGLDFDHVFLLGLDRDRFPPRPGSDAWLDERDRLCLRAHLMEQGLRPPELRPPEGWLPPLRLAREEEAILREDLRALLVASRQSLTLSFQRADVAGREKSPSLWLRHLSRVLLGTERVETLPSSTRFRHEPWPPPERIRARRERDRPLSVPEALEAAAFEQGPDGLVEAARRFAPALEQGLARSRDYLGAKESFEPAGKLPYDAIGLEGRERPRLSVSAFESLGSCPLQFCFRHLLGVRPLDDEPSPERVSMLRLGGALHEILHRIFQDVLDAGLFARGSERDRALRHATARVAPEVERCKRQLSSELCLRLPLLERRYVMSWNATLTRILELDFEELWREGIRPERLEEPIESLLRLGAASSPVHEVELSGRIDRLDRDPDGRARILDYKSGGRFTIDQEELNKELFKGRRLQLLLYALMLGETEPSLELRGLTPEQLAGAGGELPRRRLGTKVWQLLDGIQETLGHLSELLVRGDFPFRRGIHCGWCSYSASCPRHHKPTEQRLLGLGRLDAWRSLPRKNSQRPLLADLEEG
ncbi:MAG: PD-(D/E)XK nuclease family protein, partial [Planctomycetota bacterium]